MHANFSRTCSVTTHCRVHNVEALGGVFADLGELGTAAGRAGGPRSLDNAPTRQVLGKLRGG